MYLCADHYYYYRLLSVKDGGEEGDCPHVFATHSFFKIYFPLLLAVVFNYASIYLLQVVMEIIVGNLILETSSHFISKSLLTSDRRDI